MTSLCLLRDGFSGNLASLLSIGREAIERNRTKTEKKTGEGKCRRDEMEKQTVDVIDIEKNKVKLKRVFIEEEIK